MSAASGIPERRFRVEDSGQGNLTTADVTMPLLTTDAWLLDHLRAATRPWLTAADRGQQGIWDPEFRGLKDTKNDVWTRKQPLWARKQPR